MHTPFDPSMLASLDDPYSLLQAVREEGTVHRTRGGHVCVMTYELAWSILLDERYRSGPIGERYRRALPPGAARTEMGYRINFLDPPDHPRVRRLVSKAFGPTRVARLRPWVEQQAARLLAAVQSDRVDLRSALTHPLPSAVISELLGVPLADRDLLTEWTEATTPLLGTSVSPDDRAAALDASERFASYMEALIAQRRRHPGDDLLTAMAQAEEGGERLRHEELLSLAVTLYSAGHRTTRDLFGHGIVALLRHPDQLAQVRANRSLVAAAVSEFLRYGTPTMFVSRIPVVDTELAPAGTQVLIYLAAANRDPARFPDPDRFDVHRPDNHALSFAAGPHHCLGASLARMEAEVMLGAVLDRWPSVALDPDVALRPTGTMTFRGLAAIPLLVGP